MPRKVVIFFGITVFAAPGIVEIGTTVTVFAFIGLALLAIAGLLSFGIAGLRIAGLEGLDWGLVVAQAGAFAWLATAAAWSLRVDLLDFSPFGMAIVRRLTTAAARELNNVQWWRE